MVAGLDSWQAMELDIALAIKYSTLEKEEKFKHTEALLHSIDNVIRANGGKIAKRKIQPSLIRSYKDPNEAQATDDLPDLADVIAELSGGVTVLSIEGKI